MREQFPRKQPGDDLSANHVNGLSEAAERLARFIPGTALNGRQTKGGLEISGFAPFTQHIIQVLTEIDVVGVYSVFRRWYSNDDQIWKNDELQEYQMDASDFGTTFSAGDRLIAYWDDQRGMFIPIGLTPAAPSFSIPIRTRVGGIPARVANQMGSATCDLLSTTSAGILTSIGTKLIFNISDEAVGHCKVGKADPVEADDGTVIYVIDVESCIDIDLVAGVCPDDGIADVPPTPGTCKWEWDGNKWVQIDCDCPGGGLAGISPRDAGTAGQQKEVACASSYCSYEADVDGLGVPTGLWTFMSSVGCASCSPPNYPGSQISQQAIMPCD